MKGVERKATYGHLSGLLPSHSSFCHYDYWGRGITVSKLHYQIFKLFHFNFFFSFKFIKNYQFKYNSIVKCRHLSGGYKLLKFIVVML